MSALALLSPKPRASRLSNRKAHTAARNGPALDSPNDAPLMYGHERIMPKLAVSQPSDPLEAEADRVADRVMRMADTESVSRSSTGSQVIQRKCSACVTARPM